MKTQPNKSLDRSGDSVFRNLLGAGGCFDSRRRVNSTGWVASRFDRGSGQSPNSNDLKR
jgi:hypothetical protein